MSGYDYGRSRPAYTYLVGPEDSFERYLTAHGVKTDDLYVQRLSTMSAAKALTPQDQVVFLRLWETLEDAKRIARHVAYLRAIRNNSLL